ncbi:MAG: type II toxin-antitoxin system HicA family toxin [Eubacterium sp.]|nr:type II toxin-antitoxin system HicA family toxin [Eubacterium sp.]
MNQKIYNDVISGKSDNSINFNDFRNLIVDLGFTVKGQKSSHKSYYHSGINERMTIQNAGSKAKGYQVRQLRNIIIKHGL